MKTQFTMQQLDTLQATGKIRGYSLNGIVAGELKQAKYRNKKVEIDGRVFDSKKEASRYLELKMLVYAGDIKELECQCDYLLIPANGKEKRCVYRADFRYKDRDGNIVVEDVKSPATRKLSTYIMKRKLMVEKFGITIKEI